MSGQRAKGALPRLVSGRGVTARGIRGHRSAARCVTHRMSTGMRRTHERAWRGFDLQTVACGCAEKCCSLSVRRACRICPLAPRLSSATPRAPAGCTSCAQALPCCVAKRASVGNGQCALLLRCALPVGLRAVPLSQLGVGPEVSNNMGELLMRASLALHCTPALLHTGFCTLWGRLWPAASRTRPPHSLHAASARQGV